MPLAKLPYPPLELANRVGSLEDAAVPLDYYEELGRDTRGGIVERLPTDWSFSGKRILDFGCGAGRTLRQFTDEASDAEFWGCDIDEASIRWMEENLCPPFNVFVNDEAPPLAQPDASFDLIWAISVFTHLTSSWSQWLVELHRLLKPDGLLFVTFMGRGMSEEIAHEPWDEDAFGMNVTRYGQSWDLGGPMVIHSPWWIEEHWGRAFEILSLDEDGFASKPWLDHGTVLLKKRGHAASPEELAAIAPGEPREAGALAHNVKQLLDESLELRTGLEYMSSKLAESLEGKRILEEEIGELGRVRDQLSGELDHARQELERVEAVATLRQRAAAVSQQQAATARDHSLKSAGKLLQAEEVLAQSRARVFALEQAVDELQDRRERADRVLASMKSSISWRITAPLRALKRLAR